MVLFYFGVNSVLFWYYRPVELWEFSSYFLSLTLKMHITVILETLCQQTHDLFFFEVVVCKMTKKSFSATCSALQSNSIF